MRGEEFRDFEHAEDGAPPRYTGTPWRCGRYPAKRCYSTMRAASYAADWMRRREADAHLVRIFECPDGHHLHVGHDTEYEPPHPRLPPPPPLTVRLELPEHLRALAADSELTPEREGA